MLLIVTLCGSTPRSLNIKQPIGIFNYKIFQNYKIVTQFVAGVASSLSLTLILRRSRTGTVWFYTPTSNKRAARPKLYTKSLTRDLKRTRMYSRFTLVRISIKL